MKKYTTILKYALLVFFISFSSCETTDLNQLENPSSPSQDLLDPVSVFNYVQVEFPNFVDSANNFTQQVTRQMAMTGGNTYDNAFSPESFSGNWAIGYNILNAIKAMEPKSIAQKEYYALGAAKVIRVYILLTMVDMYGDIPYTEALMGNDNLNPKFDKSADIYKGLLVELEAAKILLDKTQNPNNSASKIIDLYYSSEDQWISLANTIKLKMLNNARLAGSEIGIADIGAEINSIISSGNYIDSPSKDFVFRYGSSRFNPNTRHPMYNDQYEQGGGAYIGNYMMWAMTTEKGFITNILSDSSKDYDPRIPFYFYKQAPTPTTYLSDTFTLPRGIRPNHYDDNAYKSFYISSVVTPYVVSNWTSETTIPADGFWGRDHGDNSGTPPDSDKRTVGGIYPCGGNYGKGGSVQHSGEDGAKGAGIMPIILSSFVHFMKAEAILKAAVVGDAKIEFQKGIEESIDKTINLIPNFPYFPGTKPDPTILSQQKTRYVNWMLGKYNTAANDDKKLEIIIKEYYIAAWGNGIEPYNNYRRTGFPSNFQPTIEPVSGAFFATALYPSNSISNNTNAPQSNEKTKKVFWDKLTTVLH